MERTREQDRILELEIRLREFVAWKLMHFWPELLENPPTTEEAHFVGEYLLAVQSGRGTSEATFYAKKEGVETEAWVAKIESAITEEMTR